MSGPGIRKAMLEVIDRLQVNQVSYPEDTSIAAEMQIGVEEVRKHLGILREEGKIKLNRTMHGHSAGFDPVQRQRFRESWKIMPPSDPEADRVNILRTIVEFQGDSSGYIGASRIAAKLAIPLDEVNGHLAILTDGGKLELSRTGSGYSAFLLPKQRQLFREQVYTNETATNYSRNQVEKERGMDVLISLVETAES